MPLPTTGEMRFSDFGTEFGDTAPYEMSDMYRGGPFVDANISSTSTVKSYGPTEGPFNFVNVYGWRYTPVSGTTGSNLMYWAGAPLFSVTWSTGLVIIPFTVDSGSYSYTTVNAGVPIGSDIWYPVGRRLITFSTVTTNTPVNTSVPTANQIGWTQLRGARNY